MGVIVGADVTVLDGRAKWMPMWRSGTCNHLCLAALVELVSSSLASLRRLQSPQIRALTNKQENESTFSTETLERAFKAPHTSARGTIETADQVLGISYTRAVSYITSRLIISLAKTVICMPESSKESTVEDGFFALADFPGVIGAVDGTLVRIARPA
ncbi:uncharacterized protein PITG_03096 [Phytophthora infestans T30-4]|uniref:DDE Tnp4 domain-containing protein n=1 Tax=Phytophthora infestans (strain T30-4) TaxID=403677 RepID=D0MZC8_PHYIT|nr:uncharacterized protein PITG_03096 [Phytophthora infestans T30-4]EEY65591.1 hypothetical protein PITG_03096 [Phytophthora infestans T30-4]|eukprot:XP_002906190.1 hypothetical protein PITG_03096 [Phytophthora infestans T30-4]